MVCLKGLKFEEFEGLGECSVFCVVGIEGFESWGAINK